MAQLDFPETIETERLLIQRLRYEDAEEVFYTYASKPEATKFLAWPTHRSIEDTRGFIRYATEAWTLGLDYAYDTEILAASVRHAVHLIQCAEIGADVATCPLSVITGLLKHPLTDIGLEKFLADHKKVNG